jgi:hypothetical protein
MDGLKAANFHGQRSIRCIVLQRMSEFDYIYMKDKMLGANPNRYRRIA